MGVGLKILPKEGSDLILAAALVSIICNTILFHFLPGAKIWAAKRWPNRSLAVLEARTQFPTAG